MNVSGSSLVTRPRTRAIPAHEPPGPALGRIATCLIAVSIVLMAGALLLRSSWMAPPLHIASPGPPWALHARISGVPVVAGLWAAGLLGGTGVAAGLLAVRRGGRVPLWTLLVIATLGVIGLVVLPPAGSTDALDYAVYGHIAVAGHNPYVMTPAQFSRSSLLLPGVPRSWQDRTSVYGPLATLEQLVAAWLGPGSLAATVYWLKLANAIAFLSVGVAAHRLLCANPAARLRAHLLWTANPLLLWAVIAAGHLDVLAAALGLAGLLLCDCWLTVRPTMRAIAAGACIAAAIEIKASYALFGLAAAWSMRRRPGQLLLAVAAAAAVLVPSFVVAGSASITAALRAGGGRGIYEPLIRHVSVLSGHVLPVAGCLAVAAIALALWRLPPGYSGHPYRRAPYRGAPYRDSAAVRIALAIGLGWLLVWPDQYAWYAVMVVCVLIFYPASRLDWLVLAWLTMTTISDMPGRGLAGRGHPLGLVLADIHSACVMVLQPLVVAGALATLVVLCLNQRWAADLP